MADQLQTLDLSRRLRELMLDRNLSVSDLAKLAGVSKSAMEKYLAGPSSPRAVALANICSSLGVSLDWLMLGKVNYDMQVEFIALTYAARQSIAELLRYTCENPELRDALLELGPGNRRLSDSLEDAVYVTAKKIWFEFRDARETTVIGAHVPLPPGPKSDHKP